MICELVGMDLGKCDTISPTVYRRDQDTINQGIPHLNRAISSINKDIQVISPWLGSTIHTMIHHKIHHKYPRLEDGLFVCGISLTSGQLVSELFPDCTRSCFSQVVSRRTGGDRIYEMRCLFVAVGPNARFIVLPHWDNMS